MDVRNRTPLTGNALARDSRHISMAERAAVKHIAPVAASLPCTVADFAAPICRCRYLDIPLHPISSEQQSSWNNVPLRHGGKRKAPGRLSPGPAVPLLTRGLIRDRHANAAHGMGHFWAWRFRGAHTFFPYWRTAILFPTAAPLFASTSQPHASVTPQCVAERSLMQATALGLC
jgi:hypothetical protein